MSFQQGLSGLNAASKNLDVIGHNIANSGTVGFKASRAEFADMVASAIGGAGGGNNTGLGVEVSNVAQQFTQGSLNVTGNNLDVAINGGGFFTLQLPDGSQGYTRAGNFKLDKEGNMVTNDGARVMGYEVDPVTGLRTSTEPQALVFPTNEPIAAKQTTKVYAAFNLDARAPDAVGNPAATPPVPATPRGTYGTTINVFDSQGVAKPVSLYFEKNGNNSWDVYDQLDDPTAVPPVVATSIGTITFDANGAIATPAPVPPSSESLLTLTVDPSPPNPNGLPTFTVDFNLNKVTQFGSKFAVSDLSQDGYASGQITGINIEDSGMITARYSNGVTRTEAQLALSNFRNPQGLTAIGGNNWVQTFDSGTPVYGVAGEGTFGGLRSGALEESNVDLTAELVNMLTAQRSYQANAQTIKTQDQVLSTLVNLR